jgi:hypothetical protein
MGCVNHRTVIGKQDAIVRGVVALSSRGALISNTSGCYVNAVHSASNFKFIVRLYRPTFSNRHIIRQMATQQQFLIMYTRLPLDPFSVLVLVSRPILVLKGLVSHTLLNYVDKQMNFATGTRVLSLPLSITVTLIFVFKYKIRLRIDTG